MYKRQPPGDIVTAEEVKKWRSHYVSRKEPWTREELTDAVLPSQLKNSESWKVSIGNEKETVKGFLSFDSRGNIAFNSKVPQVSGYWFQVELPETSLVSGLRLDAGEGVGSFPRAYRIDVSLDGKKWKEVVSATKGNGVLTWAHFKPSNTKYLRVTLTEARSDGWTWTIAHMDIFKNYTDAASASLSKINSSASKSDKFTQN